MTQAVQLFFFVFCFGLHGISMKMMLDFIRFYTNTFIVPIFTQFCDSIPLKTKRFSSEMFIRCKYVHFEFYKMNENCRFLFLNTSKLVHHIRYFLRALPRRVLCNWLREHFFLSVVCQPYFFRSAALLLLLLL